MTNLPLSWSTVGLLDTSELLRGVTYTKADASEVPFEGCIPVIRANNIQARSFDLRDLVYVPDRLVSDVQRVRKGDVVVATSSGSISVVGKAAQAADDMRCGFGAFCGVLRPSGEIDRRYFGHFFSSDAYRSAVSSMARGVSINNLKRDHFAILTVPLAPRAEQTRIADKLDAILARVDACRDRLDRAPAILKRFRQSVLVAATSGRLTEDWREEREVEGEWPSVELDAMAEHFSYGSSAKSAPTGAVPVLRMGNIQSGRLDWSDLVYTSDSREIAKYRLARGDVLFNRTNSPELVGKTAVYLGEREAVYAGYLIRVRCSAALKPEYLSYCLGSPAGRDYCWRVKSDGVSQSNISAKKLAAFEFLLPTVNEQTEIVRRVESLFAWADRLEARQKTARAQVERLTPALLAKAFRGELVPQDPADEPASELLTRLGQRPADNPTGLPKRQGAKPRRANVAPAASSA